MASSDDSGDSSCCFVSTSDPAEVVSALGASDAKLIGGQVVGSLRFESRNREREFFADAGGSFCFPLMEWSGG